MMLTNEKLINKISIPVLPPVLMRENLFQQLCQKESYKATWIAAKAGSGKTTLAASYLNHEREPHIWYRFDHFDDVSSFYFYMEQALNHVYPEVFKQLTHAGAHFNKNITLYTRRYFETLSNVISKPLTIVLENYQEIPDDSPLHDIIRIGIESTTNLLHFIILSRKKPHLKFVSHIANKNIRIIHENKLLMNKEESAQVIRNETGIGPSQNEIEAIYQKTLGWITGLILITINHDENHVRSLEHSQDINHYLNDYFESELFSKLDSEIQIFLMKTSILEEIAPEVSEAITGVKNSSGLLADMHSSKYFIEKFSCEIQSYRYHPLFKEFLRLKLENTYTFQDIFLLKQKAALSLEKHENYTLSANLFSNIKDYDNLVRLLHEIAHDFYELEMFYPLIHLLEKIPIDRLVTSPWIQFWLGSSYRYIDAQKSFSYLKAALALFIKTDNKTGFINCWEAISATIYHARDTYFQFDEQLEIYRSHLKKIVVTQTIEMQAAILVNLIKIYVSRFPDDPDLPETVHAVIEIHRNHEKNHFSNQVIMMVIDYCYFSGHYIHKNFIEHDIKKITEKDDLEWFEKVFTGTFRIKSFFWNDQPACKMLEISLYYLREAKKSGIQSYDQILYPAVIHSTLLQSDFTSAKKYLCDFKSILDLKHKKAFMLYNFFQCQYCLCTGKIEKATSFSMEALNVSKEVGHVYWTILCRFAHFQALLFNKDIDKALNESKTVLEETIKYKSSILEYMCLLGCAFIYLRSNKMKKSNDTLKKALDLGNQHDYLKLLWWSHKEMLSELCNKALEKGYHPAFIYRIIKTNSILPPPLIKRSVKWPWPVKIYTLGKFEIFIDDKKLVFTGKGKQKPIELLQVIIAHHGFVSTDTLIDLLWYNTDADLAVSTLNTTINRLRNMLKYRDIINVSNGKVSINSHMCYVDVYEFYRILKTDIKNKKSRVNVLKRAISIYKNHFLIFERETSSFLIIRQKLSEQFLKTILDLAENYAAHNKFEKAIHICKKGLGILNSEEILFQKSIIYHLRIDDVQGALITFNNCESILKINNKKPSLQTIRLVHQVN